MKRACVLVFLPLVLFGLETVNLIKNHSFEKEDDVWETYTGTRQPVENDSAKANAHDSERAFTGLCSASDDTRFSPGDPTPPPITFDSAVVIQGFSPGKMLEDLDSLFWVVKVTPSEFGFTNEYYLGLSLLFQSGEPNWIWGMYRFYNPEKLEPAGDNENRKLFNFGLEDDTAWAVFERSLTEDWINTKALPSEHYLDSIGLLGCGALIPNWLGQKVYWDDIRLMGYADYDVGVKEIFSGDSLEVGTPYQPVARIKNFGRENADSFLVIAEIWDGSSLIYVDTLPWTLTGDTEDTVTFADFDPPTTGPYTLTVRTFMTPDECDEDDEMFKEIGHTAVSESPLPEGISLKVRSIASPLCVSFSLPYGEHGTLTLYDATGRRIERMAVTRSGSVEFKAGLASGVYLVRLKSKQATVIKKAVVLR